MVTGGVRVDEKRSFALFVSQGDTYVDHAPGDIYSIRAGLNFADIGTSANVRDLHSIVTFMQVQHGSTRWKVSTI